MKSAASYWALLSLLPTLLSTYSAFAAVPISAIRKTSNLPTVANKFIIEVEELANIPNKRSFERAHDAVYSELRARDVEFEVTKEYDSEGIFVGAALVVTDVKDAVAIENTPGVKSIRPVLSFRRPKILFNHVVTGVDDPELPVEPLSTHVMGNVDKVHAEGNIGRGIKIGILDTGIDYNHPALGGGIGPDFLVTGGYDFVGDAYTGANEPVPDSDPMDCEGHGTHVAGIISAQPGNPYGISGVAYGASINAYRVFGCAGSATEDVLVDALLRGHADGNDILTLSLGEANGWAQSASAVVSNRIAATGKIVTIAAGNDGSSGSWYSSTPGNAHNAISVASVANTAVPMQNATVHGVAYNPITYYRTNPLPTEGSELPVYATSNSTTVTNDACDPLPTSTPDLSPYVVIIRRGSCTFVQKLSNVFAKGATVALIYDNGNGFSPVALGDFNAALIQSFDGEFIVQQYAAGAPIRLSFPQAGASTNFPDPQGGLMSFFSSYGPSNDFQFKPAVAAPGGGILSTIPVDQGSYGVKSGTSMATPYMAGTAALLLAAKGKTPAVAKSARDLFETTANKISSSKTDGDPFQTLTQAGAGLADVYKAIHTTTIVSPGELILNDTANFKSFQTFTIENKGKTPKTYKLTHVPAGTALTQKPNSTYPALGPVPLSPAAASVVIVPDTVFLLPGTKLPVVLHFTPPRNVDASLYPVYSGFVDITSGSEIHHVSYLGLVGSLKNKPVFDNTPEFFGFRLPALLDGNDQPQAVPSNYTFAGGNIPSLLWRLVMGTPALRIDLVDANINFKPTLQSRDVDFDIGSLFTFPWLNPGGSFAQVKIVGTLASFDYISRHNEDPEENAWSLLRLRAPTFANGTTITNGQYRVLFRALKVTGNSKRQGDYESWLSPVFGISL
ncbi:unnamed protein product [Cyclocybe aegerita]|uniref:Minor extracellular protease vpr n=1 Tax=Cyclocybe aegerita TaxID=1973307 RepID=A0A8S0W382_CYCAE|nr:unnamed protein product [Cyclocybe aegerita]